MEPVSDGRADTGEQPCQDVLDRQAGRHVRRVDCRGKTTHEHKDGALVGLGPALARPGLAQVVLVIPGPALVILGPALVILGQALVILVIPGPTLVIPGPALVVLGPALVILVILGQALVILGPVLVILGLALVILGLLRYLLGVNANLC